MLFQRFESVLRNVLDPNLPEGTGNHMLVGNSAYELWAILDLDSVFDLQHFNSDPRNVAVCMINTPDLQAISADLDFEHLEDVLANYAVNVLRNPRTIPFTAFNSVPTEQEPNGLGQPK